MTSYFFDPLTLAPVPARGARKSRAPVRRGKGPLDLFLFPPHPGGRGNGNPGTFPAERFQDITMTLCILIPSPWLLFPPGVHERTRGSDRRQPPLPPGEGWGEGIQSVRDKYANHVHPFGGETSALRFPAPREVQPVASPGQATAARPFDGENVHRTFSKPPSHPWPGVRGLHSRRSPAGPFPVSASPPEGEGIINSALSRPNGSRILQ